ncbi:hypothetical protein EW146_g2218 [Bondarzewia mesenterica]|uniref:Uncharacterized protein n=1 Tax=Bondarzewia mesenterica TaxID=1095465 RepID=A0A4S4M196_9AGAM|nr:hypothetical protein EW146_g2218 [Bondarzewia mesenterica]
MEPDIPTYREIFSGEYYKAMESGDEGVQELVTPPDSVSQPHFVAHAVPSLPAELLHCIVVCVLSDYFMELVISSEFDNDWDPILTLLHTSRCFRASTIHIMPYLLGCEFVRKNTGVILNYKPSLRFTHRRAVSSVTESPIPRYKTLIAVRTITDRIDSVITALSAAYACNILFKRLFEMKGALIPKLEVMRSLKNTSVIKGGLVKTIFRLPKFILEPLVWPLFARVLTAEINLRRVFILDSAKFVLLPQLRSEDFSPENSNSKNLWSNYEQSFRVIARVLRSKSIAVSDGAKSESIELVDLDPLSETTLRALGFHKIMKALTQRSVTPQMATLIQFCADFQAVFLDILTESERKVYEATRDSGMTDYETSDEEGSEEGGSNADEDEDEAETDDDGD